MARLMTLCADRLEPGTPVADRLLQWPGDPRPQADNLPLRFAGALHALRLDGLALDAVYPPHQVDDNQLWAAILTAMGDHETRILHWLQSAPQTNEVRRSVVILPVLTLLQEKFDRPFGLLELGSSGGLNLFCDQFSLKLPGATLGASTSGVVLEPDWQGPMPSTDLPHIPNRRGVDLNPLNPAEPSDQLRLLAYLWPDQPDRIQRTRAAIDIAQRQPGQVAEQDAGEWLEEALSAPSDVGRLVFHTIAWQYFPAETANTAERAMRHAADQATTNAPFAHLSMEADGRGEGASVRLSIWPDGITREIARADFHGRWVHWTGL